MPVQCALSTVRLSRPKNLNLLINTEPAVTEQMQWFMAGCQTYCSILYGYMYICSSSDLLQL